MDNKSRTALRKRSKRRPTPIIVRWLRFSIFMLDRISPHLAARRVYKLWFTSPRYPEPSREIKWRKDATTYFLPSLHGPIATYEWGSGPTILLVHGWSGRGCQMGAFIKGLVDSGHKVVAFDAPGHGNSPGNSANIFQIKDALLTVAQHTGPINGVIAHSFGVLVVALAMRESLPVSRAVCLSSPTTAEFLVDRFAQSLRVPNRTTHQFKALLENKFGANIWCNISAEENVRTLKTSALIIHDEDDLDVPWELSKRLAEAWPESSLMITKGLGHRRVLRNRKVIQASVDFLTKP